MRGRGCLAKVSGPPHWQSQRGHKGDVGTNKGAGVQGQGWKTLRGSGEVLAHASRHKSMVAMHPSPVLSPGDRGDQHHNAKVDREQLARGADPSQALPAAPQTTSSRQRPIQHTQLFFFFFLASASLLLPMLEWLVMLLRLEMLSEEFCRLMRSSGASERSRRDREKSNQQTPPAPMPGPCALSSLRPFPSTQPEHLRSSWSHLLRCHRAQTPPRCCCSGQ